MMQKILLSGVVTVLFMAGSTRAENGLWSEGKDHLQDRVNVGLKAMAPDAYVRVSEKTDAAVVNISTTQVPKAVKRRFSRRAPWPEPDPFSSFGDFFGDFFNTPMPFPDPRQMPQKNLGSGFLLSPDGYIVTNNHVVADADEIRVTLLGDDTPHDAKIVGRDQRTDVALLKINTKKKLTSVILGDSFQLRVGDIVIAIGNPFGLSHSVTHGIVSAKERSIGAGPYDDFIQTDASINPGNSGGPLLNLYGEVVGINTAIMPAGQGIGFAIPINLAKSVLLKLKNKGKVVRGWLGVEIQKVDEDHVVALKLKERKGALVANVQKESPADRGGIRRGDVILSFDGKPVKESNDLPLLVGDTAVGRKVRVDVIRDGVARALEMEVGELKDEETGPSVEEGKTSDAVGIVVGDLDEPTASRLGLEKDTRGVFVADVAESSTAIDRGLRRGDVILEVDRKSTPTAAAYRAAVKGKKKGDNILLLIKRGRGTTLFIAFTL